MFDRILKLMREKIRTNEFVVTLHAQEEMDDDGLTVYDVERCILSGEIVARQRDDVTGERKYLIRGPSCSGDAIIVAAKIGPTKKLVMITVFRE